MITCSKCGNGLRQPNAAFCHACGGAQQPDAPNAVAGKVWRSRLRATQHPSAVWKLLWILSGPVGALLFPLHLRAATLRLRRHVRERTAAPAFATPRFKDSEEGRHIVQRLVSCGSGWAIAGACASLLLALFLLGIFFLTPLTAPAHIPYERALSSIMDGRGMNVRTFHYVGSPGEYEAVWQRFGGLAQTTIAVESWEQSNHGSSTYGGRGVSSPYWDNSTPESQTYHRPYEYLVPNRNNSNPLQVYRVSGLTVVTHWGDVPVGIIVGIGLGVLYLSYLLLGVQFWRSYARHVTAEAFAAAYARSDNVLLDRLLPGIKARNSAIVIFGIVMAVSLLQLVLLPFVSAVVFSAHEEWEQSSGVADALGA